MLLLVSKHLAGFIFPIAGRDLACAGISACFFGSNGDDLLICLHSGPHAQELGEVQAAASEALQEVGAHVDGIQEEAAQVCVNEWMDG